MIQVRWVCPKCQTVNQNDIIETERFGQFCDGCNEEFYVDTDDLVIDASKVRCVID